MNLNAKCRYRRRLRGGAGSRGGSRRVSVHDIEREDFEHGHNEDAVAAPYEKARINIELNGKELHEISPNILSGYIDQVVAIESPIHITEVSRRITEGAGLKRCGARIQQTLNKAIQVGIGTKGFIKHGVFLWKPDMDSPEVRDRSGLDNGSKKFEFVSPEEIEKALYESVVAAYSLPSDDAITSSARIMGFQRLTTPSKNVINERLCRMVDAGVLMTVDDVVTVGQ